MRRYELALLTAPLWVIASSTSDDTLAKAAYLATAALIAITGMIDLAREERARREIVQKVKMELQGLQDKLRTKTTEADTHHQGGGYA